MERLAAVAVKVGLALQEGQDLIITAPLEAVEPFVRGDRKVGRNEPCPCGSGKKFKHCHGALAGTQ